MAGAEPTQSPLLSSPSLQAHSISDSEALRPPKQDGFDSSVGTSPAPSFAESFSTALTSPSHMALDNPPSTSLLPPPSSLKKSISVDSFVQYGRDHIPIATRPNRGHTSSALEAPKGLLFDPTHKIDRERRITIGRSRGASVSSAGDDRAVSVVGESDVERSDILNTPIDAYNRISLKGQDKGKSFVSGGELPLPSRTPTLSTTSSMSSIMTASTSSSTQEGVPRMQSASSLHSMARRSLPASSAAGRSRSGSLGMYPTSNSSSRRMMINTSLSGTSIDHHLAITLVVVGVAGCGKSMVIRKGLKGYGLSDPSASLPGTHSSSRYTRRVGKISKSENTPECPLNVIEVDIPSAIPDTTLVTVNFLPEAPRVDGALICYDASDEPSFRPVEALLRGYRAIQLPTVVLACKSDMQRAIDPQTAVEILLEYDVGLVEVTSTSESGKEKMKRSFDYLLKAIIRDRRSARHGFDDYRNPASPDLVSTPPWEGSSNATPTVSSASSSTNAVHAVPVTTTSSLPTIPASRTTTPSSPPFARPPLQETPVESTIDNERLPVTELSTNGPPFSSVNVMAADQINGAAPMLDERKPVQPKESRSAQWATLDELLDKLLFLTVSGDDPTYITHFLLTYRRFASPRSLLLAMQKRMRQLDNPSGDPMFACYAQMRICHLLELWIRDYPYDFAVRGTAGALSALIKSIISKTYLLHYGSDFLPFLELLPNLVDKDASWALKVEDIASESDDSYSLLEEEEEKSVDSSSRPPQTTSSPKEKKVPPPNVFRERKGSLPLTAKALLPHPLDDFSQYDHTPDNPKQQLRELQKLAVEVNNADPEELAREITRLESKLFLDIEPRHWLHYTFVSGKKDPETNSIARFNNVSNHLADWVVSLILCHDKPRMRAKQIEKLVEVAQKLRTLNNYSALRAFVAGINNSTYPGDQTMEQFKARCPEQAKNLQSWDVLLQHIRSHRAYRLALRNTKGACIPALEVHISDLIRSHEANDDFNSDDPSKIHWGKFNMMGRFITSTTQCQAQCRSTDDYNFKSKDSIRDLLLSAYLMDDDMQKSRITPPDAEFDNYRPNPRPPRESAPRDVAILRRLLFW
ncbi:ras GEF [Hymenopellis radicata]|nr:ras GEF [Hymenopellis radicata]